MAGRPGRRARLTIMQPRGFAAGDGPAVTDTAAPARPTPVVEPLDLPPGFEALLGQVQPHQLDPESQAQFANLRKLAFGFAREVMELPLNPHDKNFAKMLSVKQAIAVSILTATVRVRPGDLRDKDDDGVAALLEEVKRAGDDPGILDARKPTAEDLLN